MGNRRVDPFGSTALREISLLRGMINDTDYCIIELLRQNVGCRIDPRELQIDEGDLNELLQEIVPIIADNGLSFSRYFGFVELLRERGRVVDEIGEIKRANNMEVYDPSRERMHTQDLIRRYPEQEDLITRLFPILYRHFRERQNEYSSESESWVQEGEYSEA